MSNPPDQIFLNSSHSYARGLALAMPLFASYINDDSDSIIDFSYKQNHGSKFNTPSVDYQNNLKGLSFNNTDQSILIPFAKRPLGSIGAVYFELTTPSSFSDTTTKTIFSVADTSSVFPLFRFSLINDATSSNEWRWLMYSWDHNPGPDFHRQGDVEVTTGTRYRIWIVQKGDGNGPYLYVNGAEESTTTRATEQRPDTWFDDGFAIGVSSNQTMAIGVIERGTPIQYFEGTIHDFRIYSGSYLEPQEIAAHELDPYVLYRKPSFYNILFFDFASATVEHVAYLNNKWALLVGQSKTGYLNLNYVIDVAVQNTGYLNIDYELLGLEENIAYLDNLYSLLAPEEHNAFLDTIYNLDSYSQNQGYLHNKYKVDVQVSAAPYITGIYYKLVLTGDAESPAVSDLTLPMSSFQVRFRLDTQDYVSVVVPNGVAYASDIEDRSNGDIVIYAGVKYSDGSVDVDEFARADLEDIITDQGARSNSITLEGHKDYVASTPKSVTLESPSYRNVRDGVKRYRTKVDTTLKVGDTALINNESIIVDNIVYSVSVSNATMEFADG